jgi:hypothetical protein
MEPLWDWVSLATESTKFIGQEKLRVWTLTVDPSFPAASAAAMLLLPFG